MSQNTSDEFSHLQQCTTTLSPVIQNGRRDVLLNNFQIKNKSYRVLLNGHHFVWERIHKWRKNHRQQQQRQVDSSKVQVIENLHGQSDSNSIAYGAHSHFLHVTDIISVRIGDSQQATLNLVDTYPTWNETSHSSYRLKPTAQYLTINYAERLLKSTRDCNRWQVRRLTLYNADPYIVHQWHKQLNDRLEDSATGIRRVRRLLVFINPYGGRKAGPQIYERQCKPLFQLANIDATCITTQRQNQIRDILLTHDLSMYDAVCCVGGDGTVAEVINGLLFRTIREQGLNEQQPNFIPKPFLPMGVIPAGSTDTIAYSIHGTGDVATAAIHLLLGQRRGLDICSVKNNNTLLRFCASVLSYGYLGDLLAESEKYRWMGTKRYEYTGVKTFFNNRGYEAEINLLDEDYFRDMSSPSMSNLRSTSTLSEYTLDELTVCNVNCQRCKLAASLQEQSSVLFKASNSGIENGTYEVKESHAAPIQAVLRPRANNNGLQVNLGRGSSHFDSPTTTATWKTIRGKFFMICGANLTCACSRSPNGISRYSHLGDGYLDLILVRKTSMLNNLRFLLNTAYRNGDIRNLPFVEVYRTRKFQFRTQTPASPEGSYILSGSIQPITEPISGIIRNNSSWNCDGEVITDLDITMSSHCQLIDVFMRGPHSFNKSIDIGKDDVRPTPASSSDDVSCCCKNK